MKVLPVSPADAGKTVAQLLGEVEVRRAPHAGAGAEAPIPGSGSGQLQGDKDVDTLLDLMKQAQVNIPSRPL